MNTATNPYQPASSESPVKESSMPLKVSPRFWWCPILLGFIAAPTQMLIESTTGFSIPLHCCFPTYYVLDTLFGVDAAVGAGVQYLIYGVILAFAIQRRRLRFGLIFLAAVHVLCYLSCDTINRLLTSHGF